MAICLVALAKHTTDSVFSWRSDNVDEVVVLGDKLYTFLRDRKLISCGAQMPCVPDLFQQSASQTFLGPKLWCVLIQC